MTNSPIRNVGKLVGQLRADLRERRATRTASLALQRELASYTTAREVDDLLGAISDQDGPEAQQIRDILLNNLRPTPELFRVA